MRSISSRASRNTHDRSGETRRRGAVYGSRLSHSVHGHSGWVGQSAGPDTGYQRCGHTCASRLYHREITQNGRPTPFNRANGVSHRRRWCLAAFQSLGISSISGINPTRATSPYCATIWKRKRPPLRTALPKIQRRFSRPVQDRRRRMRFLLRLFLVRRTREQNFRRWIVRIPYGSCRQPRLLGSWRP